MSSTKPEQTVTERSMSSAGMSTAGMSSADVTPGTCPVKQPLSYAEKQVGMHPASPVSSASSTGPPAPLAKGPAASSRKPGTLAGLWKLVQASRRPLPEQTGNGTYLTQPTRTGLFADLRAMQLGRDLRTLAMLARSKWKGVLLVDDKTMIMERVIQLVAGLPAASRQRALLTNELVRDLWESLEHPAALFVGDEYMFRQADGSNNNILFPLMGAAGTAYARTVPIAPRLLTPAARPDPGLVFDAVMGRDQGYREHPNRVSSILWYWASIVIHDLFWTDHRAPNRSKTSSYLDLSPLYGSNQTMQDSVRTFRSGRLKPDSFADKRLLAMPPGVCVLLIMFNRFHNHVADNLAAINEGGRFTPPRAGSPDGTAANDTDATRAAWRKYDNDLFQTARLVTCGLYMNIMLVDYVRNIVNLNRSDTTFTLDPRVDGGIDVELPGGAERGTGNVVSAEFNMCYRWHACISAKDERWIEEMYGEILGKPANAASLPDLMAGFARMERSIPDDPAQRTFGGLTRSPEPAAQNTFRDEELVAILADSIEDVAGAFGARHVPVAMRAVEMLGIVQGRQWHLAGLNAFRQHFGLQPHATFEDINPDPEVAARLKHLYGHPDHVELYPGVMCEATKPAMVPGVGITPPYTISRVVLSDAVCLVRGDRHYTTDYGPHALTNWGFREAQSDPAVNHGCVFHKLILRAFPGHFAHNSVYAHYPMVVPDENRRILGALRRDHLFDFARPAPIAPRVDIVSYRGACHVLAHPDIYRVAWTEGLTAVLGPAGAAFMLGGDSDRHAQQRACMRHQLYGDGDDGRWAAHVKAFYAHTMEALLEEKSYVLAEKKDDNNAVTTRMVDVVHDVGNIVHTHFAARVFDLPLKTRANPRGVFSEQELYMALAIVFVAIFFDFDPAKSFALRQTARAAADTLGGVIATNVGLACRLGRRGLFTKKPAADSGDALAAYGVHLVRGLADAGLSTHDIAWSQVLPTATATVPNQAEVFAQAVDYYLTPAAAGGGAAYLPALHAAAMQPTGADTDRVLLGYAMEGVRLAGTFGAYRHAAADDVVPEGPAADGNNDNNTAPAVAVRAGDRVFVSFVSAARDPTVFPDPLAVNPHRPLDRYIHYGVGPHTCLGRDISQAAITSMFRALFRRRNLRRAPGPQGELKKVARPGGFFVYMTDDWSSFFPFPTTMKVMWDE